VRPLELPDFRAYAVEVPRPGATTAEATRALGGFLRDVIAAKPTTFRLMGPDETTSNRLNAVFEATDRAWDARRVPGDEHLALEGRVVDHTTPVEEVRGEFERDLAAQVVHRRAGRAVDRLALELQGRLGRTPLFPGGLQGLDLLAVLVRGGFGTVARRHQQPPVGASPRLRRRGVPANQQGVELIGGAGVDRGAVRRGELGSLADAWRLQSPWPHPPPSRRHRALV
jgi:hypothetical protein